MMRSDGATGMYYDNARYYISPLDRFNQADPEGYGNNSDPITLHKYLYVGADSINMVDPSGHDSRYYTATNGIAAHILFSAYILLRGFTPHLIGPDATRNKSFYELKPITHLDNPDLQIDDENQMSIYDVAWGAKGYSRGNATDILIGGIPTPIGYIIGDNRVVYRVTLYLQNDPMVPSGLNGQGFVLYSLTPTPAPPGLIVPVTVPIPSQRQYQLIKPGQQFNLPLVTTYSYKTTVQLGVLIGVGGLALAVGYYSAAIFEAGVGLATLITALL